MRNVVVAKMLGWRFKFHGEGGHGIAGILPGGFSAEEEPRGKGRRDGTPVTGAGAGQELAASSSAVTVIPGVRLVHLPTQSMRGQELGGAHGHINSCQISGNGSAACAANANARAVTRGKHA